MLSHILHIKTHWEKKKNHPVTRKIIFDPKPGLKQTNRQTDKKKKKKKIKENEFGFGTIEESYISHLPQILACSCYMAVTSQGMVKPWQPQELC